MPPSFSLFSFLFSLFSFLFSLFYVVLVCTKIGSGVPTHTNVNSYAGCWTKTANILWWVRAWVVPSICSLSLRLFPVGLCLCIRYNISAIKILFLYCSWRLPLRISASLFDQTTTLASMTTSSLCPFSTHPFPSFPNLLFTSCTHSCADGDGQCNLEGILSLSRNRQVSLLSPPPFSVAPASKLYKCLVSARPPHSHPPPHPPHPPSPFPGNC